MDRRALRLAACLSALCVGCASDGFPDGKIVDLSWAYDASTLYWPTDTEGFDMQFGPEGYTKQGYWYAANRFATAEHGGTHIDAPFHFDEKGWRVDEIPLRRLLGPGVTVDVSEQVAAEPDYRVTIYDLKAYEAVHGVIPRGAIVLIRTGFGAVWPDAERYLGTAERGPEAVAGLHFPGLHDEAARWLVFERSARAVGIDTASIDHGPSVDFETHQALFAHNVPAIENLANLEQLPPRGFYVVALPMKIAGGSGSPLRAIAIVP